jgi:hypothetical protein
VSVTELRDAVNAGMAIKVEGRRIALSSKYPPSDFWLVVWCGAVHWFEVAKLRARRAGREGYMLMVITSFTKRSKI